MSWCVSFDSQCISNWKKRLRKALPHVHWLTLTRKGGNYSNVLPLKAARRDSISNSTSFGVQIWAAYKPNAVSFRVDVGRIEGVRWTGTDQNSEGGYKLRSGFKPFVDQSSWNLLDNVTKVGQKLPLITPLSHLPVLSCQIWSLPINEPTL